MSLSGWTQPSDPQLDKQKVLAEATGPFSLLRTMGARGASSCGKMQPESMTWQAKPCLCFAPTPSPAGSLLQCTNYTTVHSSLDLPVSSLILLLLRGPFSQPFPPHLENAYSFWKAQLQCHSVHLLAFLLCFLTHSLSRKFLQLALPSLSVQAGHTEELKKFCVFV